MKYAGWFCIARVGKRVWIVLSPDFVGRFIIWFELKISAWNMSHKYERKKLAIPIFV